MSNVEPLAPPSEPGPLPQQLAPDYDPLADAEPFDRRHRPGRRLVALLAAAILLAITVLAASYSLFRGRPSPELTRPLPEAIPRQGAIR